jgi:hypothetical protein
MSYVVKILIPAESDIVEASLWYDAQSSGLGVDFLGEVNAVVQKLSKS